jgi:DNA-binding MarR family transcriptional regulator
MADDATVHDKTPALALEAFLPYRLNRISELVSQRFAGIYRDRYGLTRPEWRALAALGQFGEMTATAIGRHSAMHKTKISRAVAGLNARKWLTRATDASDRRVEHLTLTREGRRVYLDLAAQAHDFSAGLEGLVGEPAHMALISGLAALEQAFGIKQEK